MNMEQFFNPLDFWHVKAYKFLTKHGYWPSGFIPANVILSHLDVMIVQAKMAEAWVAAVLNLTDEKTRELIKES